MLGRQKCAPCGLKCGTNTRWTGRQGSEQGGSTFEGVLPTTELCYRKLTQAAQKGSFVWGQERNEKAEAVMGKREDRTDSKHLLSS